MKTKLPPPIRPTHIERHAKNIREIDRKSEVLQERLERTSDPESAAHMEDKVRSLVVERTTAREGLSEWYRGLPHEERKKHEDFLHRATLEGLTTAPVP